MKDSNNKEAYGCKYWRIFLEMLPAIAAEDLSSFVRRFRFAHDGVLPRRGHLGDNVYFTDRTIQSEIEYQSQAVKCITMCKFVI